MKVFIVFSALLMMGFTCVIYQGDVNRYMHEQETLKMIAEEAACQAALCLDESALGIGIRKFSDTEAEEAAARCIENGRNQLAGGGEYEIRWEIGYEDDIRGYSRENSSQNPAVLLSVTIQTEDFFRLPFLFQDSITRKSKYEIKGLSAL